MSKEIQQILNKLDSFSPGEKAILATVVAVEGSGYRLPGAKMLIAENGDVFGTVSGGCLEADVLTRARKILETGRSEILTYDTTAASTDSVFSLNMGCNGIVRILIEPVEKEKMLFKVWKAGTENRERQMVATLISAEQDLPVGGRIYYRGGSQVYLEDLPENFGLSRHVLDHCGKFLGTDESAQTREFLSERGRAEFFFENINPPLQLFIFGAGFDAIPLAAFAKNLGWRVSLVDHRAAFATRERFPDIDELIVAPFEDLPEVVEPDIDSVAVVMTHNYAKDREIMKFLLPLNLKYVGALGPKRRTEKLLEELEEEGFGFEEWQLTKLYAPVGLDIGAETPETIALSIAAEIRAVLAGRKGGFLRERKGSIYGRS